MQRQIGLRSVDRTGERTIPAEINARASLQSVENKTCGTVWICHALAADADGSGDIEVQARAGGDHNLAIISPNIERPVNV